jgi:hypothetical protein
MAKINDPDNDNAYLPCLAGRVLSFDVLYEFDGLAEECHLQGEDFFEKEVLPKLDGYTSTELLVLSCCLIAWNVDRALSKHVADLALDLIRSF